MTTLLWAIDGLDYEYAHTRDLMPTLEPNLLRQDLDGANALYTYRVWPAIWSGENGGKSENDTAGRFEPEKPPIWDRHSSVVALAPWVDGLYSQYQDEFADDYRESRGPEARVNDQLNGYWRVFNEFIDNGAELAVFGTKLPDILGHTDPNPNRIDRIIDNVAKTAESMVSHPEIDDYLIVSDHGFDYKSYGDRPSGVDAHSRRATLVSSFAGDYEYMSDFIGGWTADLDETLTYKRLEALGYK